MGTVLFLILFFGICGLFVSKSDMQRLMREEAEEYYEEKENVY